MSNNSPTKLTIRISWLGILNYLGAVLTALWVLYLLYASAGPMYTVLAFLVFGLILRFGASPLFAIAASLVYFHFSAAGVWLPVFAYLAAGAAFYNDLRLYRAANQ